MELKDKVVVITGAASGIGKATATAMARLGAQVAVIDVNEQGAVEVAAEIGGLAVACDIADEAAVKDMMLDGMSKSQDTRPPQQCPKMPMRSLSTESRPVKKP